jgi:hypothetical protein
MNFDLVERFQNSNHIGVIPGTERSVGTGNSNHCHSHYLQLWLWIPGSPLRGAPE